MKSILCFPLLLLLVCFTRKVYSSHIEETGMSDVEMERRRTYCIRISRVSKRDTLELRPVHCASGFEFCFTSTTCCCEKIPEKRNSKALAIGLGVGGVFLSLVIFLAFYMCMRRPMRSVPPPPGTADRRSTSKPPFSDTSSRQNYTSKYGSSPSSYYGDPSEKYGPPSTRYGYAPGAMDGESLDGFDVGKVAPLSISGNLPPPAYSEHSFAVGPGPAGPVVLYKPGRGSDLSSRGYSKRSSRPSSVTSWLKTQEGAHSQPPRHSSVGSERSVVRNSRPASRASSVINEGFEPEGDQRSQLKTSPSVRSNGGSTVAASEVIYNSVGAMSKADRASTVHDA
ncbi:uncharacterized protein LOC129265864 [Lytechinus pictus]|uniref:uncharacterized protein LOC129265864 n=1 Tax=Lytechinus pictus TaxID=7653 RepID=UPI0030B9FBF7